MNEYFQIYTDVGQNKKRLKRKLIYLKASYNILNQICFKNLLKSQRNQKNRVASYAFYLFLFG